MHGREIDCVVEKDDIVEHYGDANMLILAVVCREGGSRGLFRLAVPTPCHSCSSSDCYPSMRATGIKAVSREYQALTLLRMDSVSRPQSLLEKNIMESLCKHVL
jgi:hypothetical protein